jgi:hypothetical protein
MVLPLTMASTATTGGSASGMTVKVAVPSLPARFAQHPRSEAERDRRGQAEGVGHARVSVLVSLRARALVQEGLPFPFTSAVRHLARRQAGTWIVGVSVDVDVRAPGDGAEAHLGCGGVASDGEVLLLWLETLPLAV